LFALTVPCVTVMGYGLPATVLVVVAGVIKFGLPVSTLSSSPFTKPV